MMILLLTTLATAQDVLDPKRLECEAADGEYFCGEMIMPNPNHSISACVLCLGSIMAGGQYCEPGYAVDVCSPETTITLCQCLDTETLDPIDPSDDDDTPVVP